MTSISPGMTADRPAKSSLEQHAVRKAAWRFIPLLAFAYFFNYLDRTSVGFAALTMNHDLGLTATQFGWGAGIMFAGYCICEVPSNLALYRFGARRWLARIMITWGLMAAATALAVGPTSFYVIRLLLGIGEAGFFPGVIFFLAVWFPPSYRTRVLAWFTVSTPLSSLVGGPLSTWLLQMDGVLGLAGWKWMFIVEGLPACVLGYLLLKLLADKPADATWLSPEERQALQGAFDRESSDSHKKKDFSAALKDVRVYLLAAISFGFTMGSYGIGIWLPQMLKAHGMSVTQTGWVSAVPYFFATIALLWWAKRVDRRGGHIANLAAGLLIGAVALGVSTYFHQLLPAMVGITLALIGTIAGRTIFYTLPARFLSGQAAAGGLALINSIGALGGFAGPYLVGYLKDSFGTFTAGMLGLAVVLGITTLLTLSLYAFNRGEQ
ncbi:MFS transporter [Paraburkholderia madseniana]|uniref:MFS transporter n=1 Tax=Paraburkholderia madseniana TaxID=2599607 RepID=A0AAP5BHN1_9BURK|nr:MULTISPECIES: MFS transporter [Paraburkholderia]MCX4148892.1 MFS transporter [Paraburkholderia madseniana]MDN7151830.1 MFS transporter [Paraburkholderia sp. WS6]MDQ6410710.1 MFS transporter [Paraburkholderia madseniana]